jgi:hypothetical protein
VPGETQVARSWRVLWRSKEVKFFEPAKPSLVRALHSMFEVRFVFWFAGTTAQQGWWDLRPRVVNDTSSAADLAAGTDHPFFGLSRRNASVDAR